MRHASPREPEGSTDAFSCCEHVQEFVVLMVWGEGEGRGGGGHALQVCTYLASGYSDDKICSVGDLTVVFREQWDRVRTCRVGAVSPAEQQTHHHHSQLDTTRNPAQSRRAVRLLSKSGYKSS